MDDEVDYIHGLAGVEEVRAPGLIKGTWDHLSMALKLIKE